MTTTTTAPGTAPEAAARPTMVECMDALTGHDELEIEKRYGAIIELLQGSKYMRALAFSQEVHAGLDTGKAYKKVTDLTQAQLAEYFSAPLDGDGDDDDDSEAGDAGAGDPEETSDDDSLRTFADAAKVPGSPGPDPGADRRSVADSPQT